MLEKKLRNSKFQAQNLRKSTANHKNVYVINPSLNPIIQLKIQNFSFHSEHNLPFITLTKKLFNEIFTAANFSAFWKSNKLFEPVILINKLNKYVKFDFNKHRRRAFIIFFRSKDDSMI